MRGTVLFLALFMLGVAGQATAQDRPGPATLGGLKGVFLEVYADRGLESSMAALAAGKLKAAGITLASDKDWQSTQDIGLLHLDVIIRCELTKCPAVTRSSSCWGNTCSSHAAHAQSLGRRPGKIVTRPALASRTSRRCQIGWRLMQALWSETIALPIPDEF